MTPIYYILQSLGPTKLTLLILQVRQDNAGDRVVSVEVRSEDGSYSELEGEREYWVALTSFLTLPGKSPVGELMLESVRGEQRALG